MKSALLIIDLQNDFMPTGALPVPNGHEVIPIANELQKYFDVVVASQDWHPIDHQSFATEHPEHQVGDVIELIGLQQVLWPVHCVQDSEGAKLVAGLDTSRAHIVKKGDDKYIDSYSAFYDNGRRKKTELDRYLKNQGIDTVYIIGLATDYCVKYSALDACSLGYKTYLIHDACRGIDLAPGDIEKSISEMKKAGVEIIHSHDVPSIK